MGPKSSQPQSGKLFRPRLDEQLNMKHPLVTLIDWAEIERTFAVSFTSGRYRPALPPRLVAGLLYLQHAFDASDEAVINTWGRTRTGSSSAARPTCRPNYPSIRPASRAGEGVSVKKAWRHYWPPASMRLGVGA